MPLCAAVGMAALFCSVTKCPICALVLSIEMFSGKALGYILLAVIIGRIFSFKTSLYGDVNSILKIKKRLSH
jgi:H+/Cl- antiporter ClcA